MFLPGSPCSCCEGKCKPCLYCSPPCLTATFSGFSHGTGNCGECDHFDGMTLEMKRPPDPQLTLTASVSSSTGSGATISVATTRNASDGSYTVSGLTLTKGGAGYSLGDEVTFATNGCFEVTPEASITIATTPPDAQLTLSSPTGEWSTVGVVSATYEEIPGGSGPSWAVTKIGPVVGGSGYTENQTVTLTPAAGVVSIEPATARITEINRTTPTVMGRIVRASGGVQEIGSSISYPAPIHLASGVDESLRPFWYVSSVYPMWWLPSNFSSGDTVEIYTTGTDVTVAPAVVTMTVNQNGAVTAFSVQNGGRFYGTNGRPLSVELLSPGAYYKPGVVTSISLTSGGKVYGPRSCDYQSFADVCTVCPDDAAIGQKFRATLSLGESSHTFRLLEVNQYGQLSATLLEATRPAVNSSGGSVPCTSLTFGPEHISRQYSCKTNGTISISQGTCGKSSTSGCEMPDQITISVSGIPLVMSHGSSYGAGVSQPWAVALAEHCGISPVCLVSTSTGGGNSNSWNAFLLSRDESSVVLDLVPDASGGCGYVYEGALPSLPGAGRSFNDPYPFTLEDCGSGLNANRVARVRIEADPSAGTTVSISPPTWPGYTASAEAIVAGGEVSSIVVTNGGQGYAKELFERVPPTLSVTTEGGKGSGASLSATLTKNGSGLSSTWSVSGVNVLNGGSGYIGSESVVFEVEEGDTAQPHATAEIRIGRAQPTLTATVESGGGHGSGAVLGVSLQKNDSASGSTWSVSAVSVISGGARYSGSESVVFTPEDGETVVVPAAAKVTVGREQPVVSAEAAGGSGAVIAVSLSQDTDAGGEQVWRVSGATVVRGGVGYTNGAPLTFRAPGGTQVTAASGTIATDFVVVRENPNLTPYVWGPGGYYPNTAGSGAVLTATMSATTDWEGKPAWGVSSITIVSGGSGYEVGEFLWYEELDPSVASNPPYYVLEVDGWIITSVDSNGAITGIGLHPDFGTNGLFYKETYGGSGTIQSVTISNNGEYYKSTGIVTSVAVTNGGSYYKSTGSIESVVVLSGGTYYRHQSTGTAQVDVPVVSIGGEGSNATATATVDGDPSSASFGRITGISVGSGGSGYKKPGGSWRATIEAYGYGLAHASEDGRSSSSPCPTDLISRSYPMYFVASSAPQFFVAGCRQPDSETPQGWGNNVDYRWNGITATLGPA